MGADKQLATWKRKIQPDNVVVSGVWVGAREEEEGVCVEKCARGKWDRMEKCDDVRRRERMLRRAFH